MDEWLDGMRMRKESSVFSCPVHQVKAVLVNIFGGIVNCATIANGIIVACREMQLNLPLVVRLEGK